MIFSSKVSSRRGCDEGPFIGGEPLITFDLLEQLYLATAGNYSIYDRPIIKNIARYIYQVNIVDDYLLIADGKAALCSVIRLLNELMNLCSLGARNYSVKE